jgi:hypothetical protein
MDIRMMRYESNADGCKVEGAANGCSIRKPDNAADAALGRNPKGRGDLASWRRCPSHMRIFMK